MPLKTLRLISTSRIWRLKTRQTVPSLVFFDRVGHVTGDNCLALRSYAGRSFEQLPRFPRPTSISLAVDYICAGKRDLSQIQNVNITVANRASKVKRMRRSRHRYPWPWIILARVLCRVLLRRKRNFSGIQKRECKYRW